MRAESSSGISERFGFSVCLLEPPSKERRGRFRLNVTRKISRFSALYTSATSFHLLRLGFV